MPAMAISKIDEISGFLFVHLSYGKKTVVQNIYVLGFT
jgi:hypothetical protein